MEALQFSAFAIVVPALLVAGAPWELLGLERVANSLAEARRRHPERLRTALVVAVGIACAVAWRTPAAVDELHGAWWALALEVSSLVLSGTSLWLECIESPPLVPRSTRPLRIAVVAVSMWAIWVMAYLVGLSRNDWYRAYHHVAGHLSLAADQQLAAGVMWSIAGAVFIPLVFWNLVQWLRSEEDPDEELHRLVREEHRRATPRREPR